MPPSCNRGGKEFGQTDDRGADVVIECAGGESMRDTLPLTTRLVRRGGRVVIVGGFDAGAIAISLNWQRIQMSDITSVPGASFAFHDIYAELVEVLDLVACGVLKTQALITHRSRSTGSTRHSRWPRIAAAPEPYSWASRFRGEVSRWGRRRAGGIVSTPPLVRAHGRQT